MPLLAAVGRRRRGTRRLADGQGSDSVVVSGAPTRLASACGPVHAPPARARRAVRGRPADRRIPARDASGRRGRLRPARRAAAVVIARAERGPASGPALVLPGPCPARGAKRPGSRRPSSGPSSSSPRPARATGCSSSTSRPPSTSTWPMSGVTDGGRLAYMSPQIRGILGYLTRGVHDRPRALAEPAPPGRPRCRARRVRRALADRPAAPGRVPDDRPRRRRGLGPRRGVRDARGDDHRPFGLAGAHRRHDGPQAARGAAPPRRAPRPADRAREPGPVPRPRRAGARAAAAEPDERRAAVPRPRRLQGHQRLVRPPRRRSACSSRSPAG